MTYPRVMRLLAATIGAAAISIAVTLGMAVSAPGFVATHRVGSQGVTVALPAGWHYSAAAVAPNSMPYEDPLVRIVVASAPIVAYPRGCKAETFRFSRPAVGLMVVEWIHPQPGVNWPSRPRRFTAARLPVRPAAVECWPGPGGGVQFVSGGRHFAAYVLLSQHAPPRLAAQARAVLDTLAVKRR
jgi:hypothetical protein